MKIFKKNDKVYAYFLENMKYIKYEVLNDEIYSERLTVRRGWWIFSFDSFFLKKKNDRNSWFIYDSDGISLVIGSDFRWNLDILLNKARFDYRQKDIWKTKEEID